MDYLLVVYGPFVLLVAFGPYLILSKDLLVQAVAVAAPTILAGFELLAMRPEQNDELAEILFVQASALGMLALFFLVLIYLVRQKPEQAEQPQEPRPTAYES